MKSAIKLFSLLLCARSPARRNSSVLGGGTRSVQGGPCGLLLDGRLTGRLRRREAQNYFVAARLKSLPPAPCHFQPSPEAAPPRSAPRRAVMSDLSAEALGY